LNGLETAEGGTINERAINAVEEELAAILADLRRENRLQSGVAAHVLPKDIAAAYRIAHVVAQKLGWSVGGWKVGAMKEEMQRVLKTDRPIYGPVYAQFIRPSPASMSLRKLLNPIVEMEYVAKLGTDLPPQSQLYTQQEVADAVASLHPGLEIAECRFKRDERFPGLAALLADGGGSGRLVFGPPIENWRSRDIAGQEVALRIEGVETRRGTAEAAIDHPLVPLTWLVNELSRTGLGMKAQQMIATGTLSGMHLVNTTQQTIADFGPFGQVYVMFEP
jgi:2-keto-4-pentenoate hydratase